MFLFYINRQLKWSLSVERLSFFLSKFFCGPVYANSFFFLPSESIEFPGTSLLFFQSRQAPASQFSRERERERESKTSKLHMQNILFNLSLQLDCDKQKCSLSFRMLTIQL